MLHRVTPRALLSIGLALFMVSVHAQLTKTTLDPKSYETLKGQGQAPMHFTYDASTAKPIHPPVGTPKGGSTPCNCWITPDASYTLAMQPNDDGSSAAINLPFNFNLYGSLYNVVYINNNGNVSFGSPYGTFSSSAFPASGYVMVAPFWADVDTRPAGGGAVWYKVTPTALYVSWSAVGYYSMMTNYLNNFQLIITDGNDPVIGIGKNTSFCYGDMQWTTGAASSGINGFGGTPATVGANLGNGVDYIQFTRTDQPGFAYDGPFGLNDGVDWLDNKNFVFTTNTFTSNIPPIGSGIYLCDTLVACVGQTTTLDMQFLSPEPNQITTCNSYCASLSNYLVTINIPGNTASITGQFTPLASEVGYHLVTFEGTDNGAPPLTATYNLVVQVLPAPAMATGSVTTCSNSASVDLFATLNPPLATGGTWDDPLGNLHTGTLDPATDISGNYIYSVGGGSGCASVGTVTVNIVTAPNAGIDGTLITCNSNAPASLFAQLTGSPNAGGNWTDPNNAGFVNPLDPSVGLAGIYTYTVLGSAPCANDVSTVTVTINQAVDAGLDATVPLCKDAAPLNMLASLGGTPDNTGNWSDPGGNPFSGTFNASVDVPGVYTYTTAAVAPCASDNSLLTITVDPLPNAGLDASLELCADASQVILFNLLGGNPDTGGSWYLPDMSSHSGSLDPSLEVSGDYRYVALGIGECSNLSDTSLISVDVDHMPEVAFSANPLAGCDELNVDFDNTTPASQVGSCAWDFGDGNTGTNPGDFSHLYMDPGLFTVTLAVTSPDGCVSTLTNTDYIHVTPKPTAEFDATPNPATVENNKVLLNSTDQSSILWTWTIADLDTLHDQEILYPFPNVIGGVYPVCLQVWDQWGCTDIQCQNIVVKNPLFVYVPNSFTPNGDGVNDFFYASVLGSDPESFDLMIFDRWGEVIFETTDINKLWDGTRGGDILPTGAYVWKLVTEPEDGGGKKEYKGHVTLLK